MNLYIHKLFAISPQQAGGEKDFGEQCSIKALTNCTSTALEPMYTKHIALGDQRRMSKLVKMGVYAALECTEGKSGDKIDAIIIGNGLGGFERAEIFLESLLVNQERTLSPSPFMQSLHSAVAGQIALELKSNCYTMTYAQHAFSFENALIDGDLFLSENPGKKILIGGLDEITPIYIRINEELNRVKTQSKTYMNGSSGTVTSLAPPVQVEQSKTPGCVMGEGAAFFLISVGISGSIAVIKNVKLIYKPDNTQTISQLLSSCCRGIWGESFPDLVLLGNSGDRDNDRKINELAEGLSAETNKIYFKNYCGEYPTASAFALWLACAAMEKTNLGQTKKINKVVIVNQFKDEYYSIILLEKTN